MPQFARVTVPGCPHHVIQRGNRRQRVFFDESDKRFYLNLLKEQRLKYGVKIWAWCLMDNHVHFVAVPDTSSSLAGCFGETHKKYTQAINKREGWKGFLWQGRFKSFVMDESYLLTALRYVEKNPVEAGLVARPENYAWSSARARINGAFDPVLDRCFVDDQITDWSGFLDAEDERMKRMEANENAARPLGDEDFLHRLEVRMGCRLDPLKMGRRRKIKEVAKGSCVPGTSTPC